MWGDKDKLGLWKDQDGLFVFYLHTPSLLFGFLENANKIVEVTSHTLPSEYLSSKCTLLPHRLPPRDLFSHFDKNGRVANRTHNQNQG